MIIKTLPWLEGVKINYLSIILLHFYKTFIFNSEFAISLNKNQIFKVFNRF